MKLMENSTNILTAMEAKKNSPYSPPSFSAHACAKAIIIGEHAVVYGARAVAMPLRSLKLHLTATRPENKIDKASEKHEIILNDKKAPYAVANAVKKACKLLNIIPKPILIKGTSQLVLGAGLGSSAALSIAILRVVSGLFEKRLDKNQLSAYGNMLEEEFHGKPSGLDVAVVSHEEVIQFSKTAGATAIDIVPPQEYDDSSPWRFVLIDSGERSSTKKMVELAAPYFSGAKGLTKIQKFDELGQNAVTALQHGSFDLLSHAMNTSATMLDEAGIVTQKLREIIDFTKKTGCSAAKPTGAGGGGFALCLLPSTGWQETLNVLNKKFYSHNIYEAFL
ncbi:MAG: mevalonate kinase [Bdellovibrionota bacterium]